MVGGGQPCGWASVLTGL
uniref:dCMP deaminase n=1 Tax=Homo sapiens TaxID=9606 RepID=D6RIG3_HUMAN